MRFEFLTILIYNARGTSDVSKKSRLFAGKCKNGDETFSKHLSDVIKKKSRLIGYFENSMLVPVPRSSLMKPDTVFPSKTIAETLIKNKIGSDLSMCVRRVKPIEKSSNSYSADTRPSVDAHLNTLHVDGEIVHTPNIILVDDILTLGRTTMACALLMQQAYPDKIIKVFCPFRTRAFEEYLQLVNISNNYMTFTSNRRVLLPD